MIADEQNLSMTGDICICDVSLASFFRPRQRTVDNRKNGRSISCFLYLFDGSIEFYRDGKPKMTADAGDLVFIPQGEKYLLKYADSVNSFAMVNFRMVDPKGEKFGVNDILVLSGMHGSSMSLLFEQAEEVCGRESLISQFYIKELLYKLLRLLVEYKNEAFVTSNKRFAKISTGVYILTHNYTSDIPVTDLASECGISVSSFRSLFRRTAAFRNRHCS